MNARANPKHLRKPANPLGGLALLNRRNQAQLEQDQTRDLALAYRMALTGMLTGHGNEQLWSTLACSINIALLLAEAGVHPHHTQAQAIQIIKDAQEGLMRAHHRGTQHQQWNLGRDTFVIECAYRLHDAQIAAASKGKIVCAMEEVHRRVSIGETL